MNSVIRFILKLIFRSKHVNEKLLLFFFRQVRSYYSDLIIQKHHKILGGMYKGMKMPQIANHQNFTYVQVLGFYELFLQKVIDERISNYKKFIDIGCGCGYYTNGIAFKYGLPAAGIDLDASQMVIANSIADFNNLKNVTHNAPPVGYNPIPYLEDEAFHLIDIEGGEWGIMKNMNPAQYKKACFLIELHQTGEKSVEDTVAEVTKTFSKTHKVTFLHEEFDAPDKKDALFQIVKDAGVPRQFCSMLLTELRDYYLVWALIEPLE